MHEEAANQAQGRPVRTIGKPVLPTDKPAAQRKAGTSRVVGRAVLPDGHQAADPHTKRTVGRPVLLTSNGK